MESSGICVIMIKVNNQKNAKKVSEKRKNNHLHMPYINSSHKHRNLPFMPQLREELTNKVNRQLQTGNKY